MTWWQRRRERKSAQREQAWKRHAQGNCGGLGRCVFCDYAYSRQFDIDPY